MYRFQVNDGWRKGDGVLHLKHRKERVETAVFPIGGTARKRPLLAEDRHYRRFISFTSLLQWKRSATP